MLKHWFVIQPISFLKKHAEFLRIRVVWPFVKIIGQLSSWTICPLRVVTLLVRTLAWFADMVKSHYFRSYYLLMHYCLLQVLYILSQIIEARRKEIKQKINKLNNTENLLIMRSNVTTKQLPKESHNNLVIQTVQKQTTLENNHLSSSRACWTAWSISLAVPRIHNSKNLMKIHWQLLADLQYTRCYS